MRRWTESASGGLLVLGTNPGIGGMEQVVLTLAAALAEQGSQVEVVFPEDENRAEFIEWCRRSAFPGATVSAAVMNAADTHSLKRCFAFARFLRSRRPTVVNIHYGDNFMSVKDVATIRLALPRARLVATVHHPTPWSETTAKKRLMTRLAGMLVNRVVAVSQATAAIVRATPVPDRKVRVVPNGREVADPVDRVSARDALGLRDEFVVATLGRLVGHKGIDDLIEAFARYDDPNALLLVAGDGPDRGRLEELAKNLGDDRVRFLGRVPEVGAFVAAADLFALPSRLEGFGMVYLEAAEQEVPSIGCNTGGAGEVIVDGETGVLVPARDVDAIAHSIRSLAEDPTQRVAMGRAARERLASRFTDVAMADGYLAAFGVREEHR